MLNEEEKIWIDELVKDLESMPTMVSIINVNRGEGIVSVKPLFKTVMRWTKYDFILSKDPGYEGCWKMEAYFQSGNKSSLFEINLKDPIDFIKMESYKGYTVLSK